MTTVPRRTLNPPLSALAVAMFSMLTMIATAQAQILTPLHGFTYGADGGDPVGGLSQDAAGNLYGVTFEGGYTQCCEGSHQAGCGVVFKLSRHGSGWVFETLYEFAGQPDGGVPNARVVISPDGALYGTTSQGGNGACPSDHVTGRCGSLRRSKALTVAWEPEGDSIRVKTPCRK